MYDLRLTTVNAGEDYSTTHCLEGGVRDPETRNPGTHSQAPEAYAFLLGRYDVKELAGTIVFPHGSLQVQLHQDQLQLALGSVQFSHIQTVSRIHFILRNVLKHSNKSLLHTIKTSPREGKGEWKKFNEDTT